MNNVNNNAATTTPYPDKPGGPLRLAKQVAQYNAAALGVMKRHHIRVNDLYAVVQPRMPELLLPNNVHFKAAGSQALANIVAAEIQRHLATASQKSATIRRQYLQSLFCGLVLGDAEPRMK